MTVGAPLPRNIPSTNLQRAEQWVDQLPAFSAEQAWNSEHPDLNGVRWHRSFVDQLRAKHPDNPALPRYAREVEELASSIVDAAPNGLTRSERVDIVKESLDAMQWKNTALGHYANSDAFRAFQSGQ